MEASPFRLTPQQINYFNTFGFLRLPGMFKDEIDRIERGFETVFREHDSETITTQYALHGDQERHIIMPFVQKDDDLRWLLEDRRVVGITESLFDTEYVYNGSDGNLFHCESHWHSDVFGSPLRIKTIKLSFYLDSLSGESGSIRFLPGSNFYKDEYSRAIRRGMETPMEKFGVPGEELPGIAVSSEPGDLILWAFRTLHASYHGGQRRRLFSLNYAEKTDEA